MAKYTEQEKLEAVLRCIDGSMSYRHSAHILGCDPRLVEPWVKMYQLHGTEGLSQSHKRFPGEFRIYVVEYMRRNQLSQMDASVLFGIPNRASVGNCPTFWGQFIARIVVMLEIRYVQMYDKAFWYRLDRHLSEREFENKVNDKRGYVLLDNHKPIGLLRYNLFWDNTPFCTMLFIDCDYRKKGYGKKLMEYWETDMKSKGYGMVLTSTQVDEEAQFFYRKLGYKDCGGLIIDIPGYEQPMELFLSKAI